MRIQCAGCGTIISDDGEPGGTYGCCADCNKASFRTHEQNEVKASEPDVAAQLQEAEAPAEAEESA